MDMKLKKKQPPWTNSKKRKKVVETDAPNFESMDTQIFLCGISENHNFKLIIEFFHLLIIPMTLCNGIMPYFDEFIHVYGLDMSIL